MSGVAMANYCSIQERLADLFLAGNDLGFALCATAS